MLKHSLPIFLVLVSVSSLHAYAQSQVEITQSTTTNNNGHKTSIKTDTHCTSEGCNGDFTLANPDQTRYAAGYAAGIDDYNQHVNDTNHHFECPIAKIAPHGDFCNGYDGALSYMMSDQ
jgi:hypothetical protein